MIFINPEIPLNDVYKGHCWIITLSPDAPTARVGGRGPDRSARRGYRGIYLFVQTCLPTGREHTRNFIADFLRF